MKISNIKKAIKGAYIDYYGNQISDECVKRIISYLKELERLNDTAH